MARDPTHNGGSFLLAPPRAVFSPEAFSEQQRLTAQTAETFAQQEVAVASEAIERQDFEATRALLRQAGRLGLTGVDIPEAYGGLGLDFAASTIVADHLAVQGSFSVSFGAHVGIGTLPLVFFGSEEQKQKYLPRLATAEWVGAYALSEAGSGSDALAMRTEAKLTPGGDEYLLNGEKMWISNAGFADLFTVFATTGDRVTAFLVEAGCAGLATGPEEHKMGIHGSSTRSLLLRDVRVPRGNVLGEVGNGAHIAFQILNIGRFKLGAACIGGARNLLRQAIGYARQRHAFGQPIASFGLIQQYVARMAMGIYAGESAVYRTAGLMADERDLNEYAVECSMVKVHASEMLDAVVDQAVQIYGGNGFVSGNVAERAYRDARVNRIFEGTNEINRLLISGMLLRRAEKGSLALLPAAEQVAAEMLAPPTEQGVCEQARKVALLVCAAAHRRHRETLAQQQEILAMIADLLVGVYVMQSVAVRQPESVLTQAVLAEQMDAVEMTARHALAAISTGDELRTQMTWLRRLLKREPANLMALHRQIAERALEAQGYPA
ncbi:MAG TPA: acyl-CoA dehydrogenase family protein [Terriglobales bacterium]|nr:acyl-CoA dehydrogenase family protein [Terriglobales bacterium]